eukprot:5883197-Pleurochrysis_carterae.AAC.1
MRRAAVWRYRSGAKDTLIHRSTRQKYSDDARYAGHPYVVGARREQAASNVDADPSARLHCGLRAG